MLEKLNYYGYTKDAFNQVKSQIYDSDYFSSLMMAYIFLVATFILSLLSVFEVVKYQYLPKYLLFFDITSLLILRVKAWPLKTDKQKIHANRIAAIVLYSFGIVESIFDINVVATAILVFFVITAILYADSLRNYFIISFAAMTVLNYTSWKLKPEIWASGDTVNTFTFFLIGVLIHFVSQHVKVTLFRQYNELMESRKQLAAYAHYDHLSNALNRITYDKVTHHIIENHHDKIFFYLMDIDNFKNNNDEYGHSKGDFAIQAFSATVQKIIHAAEFDPTEANLITMLEQKKLNYLGRLGGDEFVAVIRIDTNKIAPQAISDQILKSVRKIQLKDKDYMSCTIGVVEVPNDIHDYNEIYATADQALYEAKDAGKNQAKIKQMESATVIKTVEEIVLGSEN